ncbi:hypothetical protein ABT317_38770, partial [Streptomyces carpinensis]
PGADRRAVARRTSCLPVAGRPAYCVKLDETASSVPFAVIVRGAAQAQVIREELGAAVAVEVRARHRVPEAVVPVVGAGNAGNPAGRREG